MKHFAILLLAVTAAFALSFEEYAQVNAVADSLNYGSGLRKDVLAGFRLTGSNWNLTLVEDWVTNGEGAVLPRFYRNHSETQLESRIRFGGLTVNPEFQIDMDIDSATVVLPLSLAEGYRNSTLQPALTLCYSMPDLLEIKGTGRYWIRDIASLNSDIDTEWSEMSMGGNVLWHTPIGGYLAAGGVSCQTKLNSLGYDQSWSRVDISAGYTPANSPIMTILTAEAGYSLYNGEDYTGLNLPNRFTARLRAVQNITRNVTCNFTFSQAADFYENETSLGPFQSAVRTRFKFSGWGTVPSSITLGGQLTDAAVTTRLGELEGRIGIFRGFSALITGRIWYGPSSVAGTGGYRTREIVGGGLEFRMQNGLNTFVVFEREASNLAPTDVWGRIRGGVGFYPAAN
jgi:hypothetical protein